MSEDITEAIAVDLVALKERIAAINTTDISTHSADSAEFMSYCNKH
ncbi:hypothetical protein EMGBS7_04860 [Candidatus Planktophila sp.]|nr:hypothetical protein EMGBS7_04860 [Candidatus Planktophila sp.]